MKKPLLIRRVNADGCFSINGHIFFVGKKYSGKLMTILRSATVLDPEGNSIDFEPVDTIVINLISPPNDPEKIKPLMDKVIARGVEKRRRAI